MVVIMTSYNICETAYQAMSEAHVIACSVRARQRAFALCRQQITLNMQLRSVSGLIIKIERQQWAQWASTHLQGLDTKVVQSVIMLVLTWKAVTITRLLQVRQT